MRYRCCLSPGSTQVSIIALFLVDLLTVPLVLKDRMDYSIGIMRNKLENIEVLGDQADCFGIGELNRMYNLLANNVVHKLSNHSERRREWNVLASL